MLTLIYDFFLRFSEDKVEDIQKEMDAMMQDIKTDKGFVAETANVGKVTYFFSLKFTPYRVQPKYSQQMPPVDRWQSKTLFLTIFDLRSSIVLAFAIAVYPV